MSDEDDEAEAAPALEDGDSVEVQGSSSTYTLSRQGSVYMCTCPAWKNQGKTVDARKFKPVYISEFRRVLETYAGGGVRSVEQRCH